MEKIYSENYNATNSFCIICHQHTDVRNLGGALLEFTCPSNNFYDKKLPIHWFSIFEDHFITDLDKILSITLSLPNDKIVYFQYYNNITTSWKTIQRDFIYINNDLYTTSLRFDKKFPKVEYVNNYQELCNKISKISKLLIFI